MAGAKKNNDLSKPKGNNRLLGTTVALPPRGEIPLEPNGSGFESIDAFWDATRSPAYMERTSATTDDDFKARASRAEAKRAEKMKEHAAREKEKRKKMDEIEDEANRNAATKPTLLETVIGDTSDDETPYRRSKVLSSWADRHLHKAMGIPAPDDSPTVLSRVSTAPPSSVASMTTHATDPSLAHSLRRHHARIQLEALEKHSLAREVKTPVKVSTHKRRNASIENSPNSNAHVENDGDIPFSEKGMDPPGELEDVERGVAPDPVEKDDVLEPEEVLPDQPTQAVETEVVYSVADRENDEYGVESNENVDLGRPQEPFGDSSIQSPGTATDRRATMGAAAILLPPPPSSVTSTVSLEGTNANTTTSTHLTASSRSPRRNINKSDRTLDQTKPRSNESTPSLSLDSSLVEVVNKFNKEYDGGENDLDDSDKEASGGFQLSTQEETRGESVDFGDSGGNADQVSVSSEENAATNTTSLSHSVASSPPKRSKKMPSKRKMEANSEALTSPERHFSTPSALRNKGAKKKNPQQRVVFSTPSGNASGYPTGNRQYQAVPVSDYKEDYPEGEEPETPGGTKLRRSRRARFKPLQFWKNEKLIFEAQNEEGLLGEIMGDMPVVTGVVRALPTPYKKRKAGERSKKDKEHPKKRRRNNSYDGSEDESPVPFDATQLRRKFHINNGESGFVWSESIENTTDSKIVSRLENRSFSRLPLSTNRKRNESKVVGFASQAFHVLTDEEDLFPGFIAGNVVLPPRGIKDAEGVGLCSQVFNVGDCQPNSLEFALADPSSQDGEFDPDTAQRFLLSKGDMFQIPPGNVYRIENHSKTVKASLFWTIIKCTRRAEQDVEDG